VLLTVLERVDLSDLDVEKISGQLQKLADKAPDLDVEKISGSLQQLKDKTEQNRLAVRLPTRYQRSL